VVALKHMCLIGLAPGAEGANKRKAL